MPRAWEMGGTLVVLRTDNVINDKQFENFAWKVFKDVMENFLNGN